MDKLTIQTSTNAYDVLVGGGLRHQFLDYLDQSYDDVLVITDSNVESLYLQDVLTTLSSVKRVNYTVVPAGEASKNGRVYFDLLTEAINMGLDRHGLIIALGGGMIGDLAGFVAATFMRGVDYLQMPTTILAHDSSVGGKVAINHPEGKNLIGSFYPPKAVIYDVETLHTIPQTEIRSGYAEIAKHSMIHSPSFWTDINQVSLEKPLNETWLIRDLIRGIEVKAKIVEQDEREANVRQFLNFGHTLGHALEAELGYGVYTHGEAVAIGMLFAMELSQQYFGNRLPVDAFLQWLKTNHYPIQVANLSITALMNRMKRDKKAKQQRIQMVLLKELGMPVVEEIDDVTIKDALQLFLRKLVK
ncbi:3-dehydroquinate synthase [Amphibacillus marinus]|uniref:3-dehydroquinate synthase n=1 Tax=Amphibacillus marinus TaxID=872970 RepID=A0A1H8GGJ0_9BACI|nr:3-dehydroquinate synthase [Amphibacillus marinus]SEN42895.1 3-dehydroquinate synthase [Amphibacillus marinus]